MNIMGMQMSKKEFIKLMKKRLVEVITQCQYELLNMKFAIANSEDFVGKCDEASDIFIRMIKNESYFSSETTLLHIRPTIDEYNYRGLIQCPALSMSCRKIHGELAHSTLIPSKQWSAEHTMVEIIIEGIKFYVDPTCLQFEPVVSKEYKIGLYHCDTKCPKWFLHDEKNIRYTKFGKWLDQHKFSINEKLDKKILMTYDIEYETNLDVNVNLYINDMTFTFKLAANETHHHEEWDVSDDTIPINIIRILSEPRNHTCNDYELIIKYHSLNVHNSIKRKIGLCEFIQFKLHGKISDLFLPRSLKKL